MKPLIPPQTNPHGTPPQRLMAQQFTVLYLLRDLRKVMSAAIPNSRDYQSRPEQYPLARDAWMERLEIIIAIQTEIQKYVLTIQEDQ